MTRLTGLDMVSNRACIDFIREEHRVISEDVAGSVEGKVCLWATVGNVTKNGIILAGHSDGVLVDSQGEKTLEQPLRGYDTHLVSFATEAGIFQKLDAPAVVCGRGFIDQAHQPNEYIDKNRFAACVDLLRQVLLSSSASQAHKPRY